MKPQEKKYLVDSFTEIQKRLKEKGAIKSQEIISTHYYGEHAGKDIEKFVEYADRVEIHVWKEQNGLLTMTEHTPIANKEKGFAWLIRRGYTHASIVKMEYSEYEYKNGTVGLYTINDFLHSIVLCYPPGTHAAIEKEFGLQNAKVISVPYNKLLQQMGRLRSTKLE